MKEEEEEEEEGRGGGASDSRKSGGKKKKRRKKSKGEEEDTIRRIEYPWYYTLGPLVILWYTCKYTKPNLVTSAVFILVIIVIARHT